MESITLRCGLVIKDSNFRSFRVLELALYPKSKTRKISESFLLLKCLVLYETQSLKTDWKMTPKKKTLTFSCGLCREKCQFPRIPSVRFCLIPKIENSEISESFLLLRFLVVYGTQNLKIDWKMIQNKKLTVWCGLRRKNAQFRGFRVFDFALYLKSTTWKPWKVFIYFKFLLFPLH